MGSIAKALARLATAEEDMARTIQRLSDVHVEPVLPSRAFVDEEAKRRVEIGPKTPDAPSQASQEAELEAAEEEWGPESEQAPTLVLQPKSHVGEPVPRRAPPPTAPRREAADDPPKRTHGALGSIPPTQGPTP